MTSALRASSLGALLAALVPGVAGSQGRIARPAPTGPIGVTLPSPPPPRGSPDGGWVPRHGSQMGNASFALHRLGQRWSYPIVLSSAYETVAPAAAVYPVPYYYPVPVPNPAIYPRREAERPAPPPYDPTRSRMVIVGSGADGGGGVLRIASRARDTLRLTWLGTPRPIREARLFLADDLRRPLRSRMVDVEHPEARFTLTTLDRPVAYAGVTVVFADGSTQTTLVPVGDSAR
ncbi:MAG: hypothetical protein ACT4P7_15315 [Gemmatimonadaceae bacterium]